MQLKTPPPDSPKVKPSLSQSQRLVEDIFRELREVPQVQDQCHKNDFSPAEFLADLEEQL
jgi:hypothetical protein